MKFDMSQAETAEFREQVDAILLKDAAKDKALKEGLQNIDRMAQERGLTFYQMAFIVMKQHQVGKRAADWLKARK
jgi:hypothetical protein